MSVDRKPQDLSPEDAEYTEWEVTLKGLNDLVTYGAEFELLAYFGDDELANDVRIRLPEEQPPDSRRVGGRMQIYIVPMVDGINEVLIR